MDRQVLNQPVTAPRQLVSEPVVTLGPRLVHRAVDHAHEDLSRISRMANSARSTPSLRLRDPDGGHPRRCDAPSMPIDNCSSHTRCLTRERFADNAPYPLEQLVFLSDLRARTPEHSPDCYTPRPAPWPWVARAGPDGHAGAGLVPGRAGETASHAGKGAAAAVVVPVNPLSKMAHVAVAE